MATREVVLCSPVRTAIGAFNGSLKTVPATELGGVVVRETLRRAGLDAGAIESVVMGNVIQAGNKMNPARQAAIGGGVPVSVPAITVNRVCGSGAQAVVTAAQQIVAEEVDIAVAGGLENMDRAPYLMDGGRWGYRMGPAEIYDSMLRDGLDDAFSGKHSGWHTEDLVSRAKLSRKIWIVLLSARSGSLVRHRRLASSGMRSYRLKFRERKAPCSLTRMRRRGPKPR